MTFLYGSEQRELEFYHDSKGQEQMNHDIDICGVTINNISNRKQAKKKKNS